LSESLLNFVLTRLDQVASPVFLHSELTRFPALDLASLVSSGVLQPGLADDEIPRPARFPGGGYVAVRRTTKGLFGCACEGDPYFAPILLTEEDVRQYEISVDRLVDRIRRDNGIVGAGYAGLRRIVALGEKRVEGWGGVDVFLAVGLHDDAAVLSACLHLKTDTSPRRVVLLVPTLVAMSPDRRRAINATGVIVEPLRDAAQRGSLVVSWSVVLGAPDMRHEKRLSKDVRIFRRDGAGWMVAYDGQSTTILHSLGMTYIQHMLERPSTSVDVTDLASAAGRVGRTKIVERVTRLSKGRKPDASTLPRQALVDLDREEAEAQRRGDKRRLAELREIRSLTEPDRRADRGKPSAESAAAKGSRQSVSAAIHRAIGKIRERHPALAMHLDDSIERGNSVFYRSDPNDRWATEGGSS
jgi:hypothetical protein